MIGVKMVMWFTIAVLPMNRISSMQNGVFLIPATANTCCAPMVNECPFSRLRTMRLRGGGRWDKKRKRRKIAGVANAFPEKYEGPMAASFR